MASALLLASAGNTAFFVIFGIFVVAMLVLVVITITWAVRHDDVVGGILEPGPQAAGQPRIEAGPRSGVAAEECQEFGPRASIRRRVDRRCGPERRAGSDEDHRCSVPTGCDTPLP